MAADDNYVWPLLVATSALHRYREKPFLVTIAYDPSELSKNSRHLISRALHYQGIDHGWHPCNLQTLPDSGHISRTAFARLDVADHILEPFMWLDADTLPLPGWQAIYTSGSAPGALISARLEPQETLASLSDGNRAKTASQGRYFNSGVMIIDGSQWQAKDMPRRWRQFAGLYREYGFEWMDQCVLNFILQGDAGILKTQYNHYPHETLTYDQAPKIVHFLGGVKPWHLPELAHLTFLERIRPSWKHRNFWGREYARHEKMTATAFTDDRQLFTEVNRLRRASRKRIDCSYKLISWAIRRRISSRLNQ